MAKFNIVATGGTFDEIHIGHIALLRKAFDIGSKVIIGVSSDQFAAKRGKNLNNRYEKRVAALKSVIKQEFGRVSYKVTKLEADFGPAVTSGRIDALVSSTETENKVNVLNEIRRDRGLKSVHTIKVPLVKADDGSVVSSTRIRAGEIDRNGRILRAKDQ